MYPCFSTLFLLDLERAVLTKEEIYPTPLLSKLSVFLCFCAKQDRKYFTFPPRDLFVDGGGELFMFSDIERIIVKKIKRKRLKKVSQPNI